MENRNIGGKRIPFTTSEQAAWEANNQTHIDDAPARDRLNANAALQKQIVRKERQSDRSVRELMRERHFPGDMTAGQITVAKNKVRQLDQEIEILRGQIA